MEISTYPDWQQDSLSLLQRLLKRRHKTHRYDWGEQGTEFFLDTDTEGSIRYMTAQRGGVRPGDYIDITSPEGHLEFQVREVEYYNNPADMWIALLVPQTAET